MVHCIDSPADYWVGPDDTAIVYSDPATDGRDVSRCGLLCSLRGHAGSCMTHCMGMSLHSALLTALAFIQAKAKRFVQDTFVPKLQGAPCQVTIYKRLR